MVLNDGQRLICSQSAPGPPEVRLKHPTSSLDEMLKTAEMVCWWLRFFLKDSVIYDGSVAHYALPLN